MSVCVPVSDCVEDALGVLRALVQVRLGLEVDPGAPRLLPRDPRRRVTIHGRATDLQSNQEEFCEVACFLLLTFHPLHEQGGKPT